MNIIECEQNSPEWWAHRRGIPTASEFGKIITPKTGKPSAQSFQYACELIAESVAMDECEPSWEGNEWTERGKLLEQEALDWFAMSSNVEIDRVGFVLNDEGTAGASPDGMMQTESLMPVEVKCPKASTHVAYLLKGELPDIYKAQVHGQLIVTGLDTAKFISYHPDFRPLVVTVQRNDFTIALEKALEVFIDKMEDMRKVAT